MSYDYPDVVWIGQLSLMLQRNGAGGFSSCKLRDRRPSRVSDLGPWTWLVSSTDLDPS